jgi:DNA polymerase-4
MSPPPSPSAARRVLHVDVDAFLASVEQALHPELRGKPVIVGGSPDSRNLVMSCSYDTRPFGVRPGLSLREARRRCPRAIFRDGDSQAAGRLREKLALLLFEISPTVEITSIDDLLVDLSGTERLHGRAFDVACRVALRAREELHLPLTLGVGANPLLARLAGKLAKPGGVGELLPGREQAFLDALPIEQLPGAGHRTAAKLERFGLRTVGELRRLVPRELLFQTFGRHGLELYARARGHDRRPVEPSLFVDERGAVRLRPPKTIRREATFEPEEGRREQLLAMLSWLVERAAHRLRFHGLVCGSIEFSIRYVPSGLGDPSGASLTRRRKLAEPSDTTATLFEHARALLDELPRRRALVKRLGLTLLGLRPAGAPQLELFADPGDEHATPRHLRARELDRALDGLRDKLGFGRVLRGSSLPLQRTHPLGPDGFKLRTPSLNQ